MKRSTLVNDFVSYEVKGTSWIMKFETKFKVWSWKKFRRVEMSDGYHVWGSLFADSHWAVQERGEPCFRHILPGYPDSPYYILKDGTAKIVDKFEMSDNLRSVYKLHKLGFFDAKG